MVAPENPGDHIGDEEHAHLAAYVQTITELLVPILSNPVEVHLTL